MNTDDTRINGPRLLGPRLLKRRQILRGAVGLGLAVPALSGLLAACGGDDEEEVPAESTDAPDAAGDPTEAPDASTEASPTSAAAADETEPAEGDATEPAGGEPSPAAEGSESEGQRGGSFSSYETVGPESLDPYISSGQPQSLWSAYTYSMLFMLETGPDVPQGSQETIPDVAASIEVSEDGTVYTIPLKDNVR